VTSPEYLECTGTVDRHLIPQSGEV